MRLFFLMLLFIPFAAADTCFTVLDSPTGDLHYWKAESFDTINDSKLSDWLEIKAKQNTVDGLADGTQYNLRIDKDCFSGYLISHNTLTGADSGYLNLINSGGSLYSSQAGKNDIYTFSVQDEITSIGYLNSITTGTIDGTDYLQLPASLSSSSQFQSMKNNVCKQSVKISDQMYYIQASVWNKLSYGEPACSTDFPNIIECSLNRGYGTDVHYATIITSLARSCGIPARVVYGISEGELIGSDIYLPESKMHYWVEYYDAGWHTLESANFGSSLPEKIETNCMDGKDNDADGYRDCIDPECLQTLFCTSSNSINQLFINRTNNTFVMNNTLNQAILPELPGSELDPYPAASTIADKLVGLGNKFKVLPLKTKAVIVGLFIMGIFLLKRFW
jgi:hypothetical protein